MIPDPCRYPHLKPNPFMKPGDVSMEIRRAAWADLGIVIPWIPDARACRWWAGPDVRFPMTVSSLAEDIDFLESPSYCGADGDGALGFGQLVSRSETRLHMTRIIIRPNRRQSGVGFRFCRALIRIAGDMGASELTLNVYRSHHRAVELYRMLGFQEAEVQPEDHVWRMDVSLAIVDTDSYP